VRRTFTESIYCRCTSASDTLKCLREANVTALQAANTEINSSAFFGTFLFVPVVDGTFITDRPTRLLKERKVNTVRTVIHVVLVFFVERFFFNNMQRDLYAATNVNEGDIFIDQATNTTVTTLEYLANLFPQLGSKETEAGTAAYAGLGLSNIQQAELIMGEGTIWSCLSVHMLC